MHMFDKSARVTRGLPVLVLCYAVLMMHFVLSRAFRDSLLGSHIGVRSLPGLTLLSTLLAISLSLLLSFFMAGESRLNVIRSTFALNGLIELGMAAGHHSIAWIYDAYYIEVSASTAIGVSMIWILIGDWASRCHADKAETIPAVLVCGTSAGMFAGFGMVHLPGATSFVYANLLLAAMNLCAAISLCFYQDSHCSATTSTPLRRAKDGSRHWGNRIVRTLALVTLVGAASSTLLDLIFRVTVADTLSDQSARIHFLGVFQGVLSMAALALQLGMTRSLFPRIGKQLFNCHPALLCLGGILASLSPGFWVLAALRAGEYSLRNSFFRYGAEMTYSVLPDETRVTVRPLIDVVGERLGDIVAAGLLELLLRLHARPASPASLLVLAVASSLLWWLCRQLVQRATQAKGSAAPDSQQRAIDAPLHTIAREKRVVV